ncbi:terminase large subunit domain-containing protein, partial [Brevundimonas lenta]|uniref:phage terminase large subunit family protein n=1 Tax=Brevundimonas lenta TaxID=424796 RepID=UPI003CD0712B
AWAAASHEGQRAPAGDWRTWVFLGGRGAGKTLAGAMWLADQAEALGAGGRLALIGPTLHDVREVMVEGASGIVSLPRWQGGARPVFEPSRRRLVFPNGAVAQAFSAEDPDSLRGPQFAAAWADEFCAWRKGGETLALLRMGLRLPLRPSTAPRSPSPRCGEETEGGGSVSSPSPCDGEGDPEGVEGRSQPRLCVTTTPRPSAALRRLRGEPGCVETHATTRDNAANLSAGFVEGLERLYGGTRKAAQELEGKVVEQEGALFTAEMMMRARSPSPPRGGWSRSDRVGAADEADGGAPTLSPLRADIPPRGGEGEAPYDRIVVAVDPTTTAGGNACGIVVAGRRGDRAVVLADWSKAGLSPDGWARRAVRAAEAFGAHAIVAEVNQGGEMVRAVLKAAGCAVRLREVRATKGKRVRAEPVAALYEQGRVVHAGDFAALEEELMALGGEEEAGSDLDRADALVWAVTDLLIDRARSGEYGPRVSVLGGPVVRTGLSARAW